MSTSSSHVHYSCRQLVIRATPTSPTWGRVIPSRGTCCLNAPGIKRREPICTSRTYNAGWQLRDVDPFQKQPLGQAVVVGAGVSGLVSALGLAKFGMQVHVFDQGNIGQDDSTSTARVNLSSKTLIALRSVGCNVTGEGFGRNVLRTSEVRGMDSMECKPSRARLPEPEVYTTYGYLKRFIMSEINRLVPGRVEFHSGYTLEDHEDVLVKTKKIRFTGPQGPEVWGFDLLVGAEGPRSNVRKVIVKNDKNMESELSFIGPMRFVTAIGLPTDPEEAQPAFKLLTSPADASDIQEELSFTVLAQLVEFASPVEVAGWPKAEWGQSKYYRIRLVAFQDPENPQTYAATLEGTPALFAEFSTILETGTEQDLRKTIEDMFYGQLPGTWVDGLTKAVVSCPDGYSSGANVLASKVHTPDAPAVVIVGDAACATTWRLGYSLQTALESALAMCDSMFKANTLGEALKSLNSDQLKEQNALVRIDRVAPAFAAEEVPMGPLRIIIRTALFVRLMVNKLMLSLGLAQWAPSPSYASAMRGGSAFQDVYKRLLIDTAITTSALMSILFAFARYAYSVYSRNAYVFA